MKISRSFLLILRVSEEKPQWKANWKRWELQKASVLFNLPTLFFSSLMEASRLRRKICNWEDLLNEKQKALFCLSTNGICQTMRATPSATRWNAWYSRI